MKYYGQDRTTVEDVGSVPIPEEIYVLVGVAPITLTQVESQARHLVLFAEVGDWRVKPGSHGAMSNVAPTVTNANGTGSLPLLEGSSLVLPAPTTITVAGEAADSVLTYFWA